MCVCGGLSRKELGRWLAFVIESKREITRRNIKQDGASRHV